MTALHRYTLTAPTATEAPEFATSFNMKDSSQLPARVDLSHLFLPVKNQLNIGSCFPAGTMVLMGDLTHKPIEEIVEGQTVVGHDGQPHDVTRIFKRTYSGSMVRVKTRGLYAISLTATSNHPILVKRNDSLQWLSAGEVQKGDFVFCPVLDRINYDREYLDVRDLLGEETIVYGDQIRAKGTANWMSSTLPLTADILRMIGLFLAEGSYRKRGDLSLVGITFSLDKQEEDLIEDLEMTLSSLGIPTSLQYKKESRCVNVRVNNSTLARALSPLCGEYAYGKEVAAVLLQLSPAKQIDLLRGWLLGDGTLPNRLSQRKPQKSGERYQIEGVTISQQLALAAVAMSRRLGLYPFLRIGHTHDPVKKPSYHIMFYSGDTIVLFPDLINQPSTDKRAGHRAALMHDGEFDGTPGVWSAVSDVESFDVAEETVYNLEVADVHTYISNLVTVHNCTGESSSYMREALTNIQRPGTGRDLSPLFVYHQELFLQNALNPVNDCGAPLNVCADVWLQYGSCIEQDDIYNPAALGETPSESAYANASQYTIQSAYQINTLSEILNCLAAGFPVQIGVVVYPSFESPAVAETGDVAMPSPGEQPLGGHALAAAGYDRETQRIIGPNSWSPNWGKKGFYSLPFSYFQNSDTFMGAFTYRL